MGARPLQTHRREVTAPRSVFRRLGVGGRKTEWEFDRKGLGGGRAVWRGLGRNPKRGAPKPQKVFPVPGGQATPVALTGGTGLAWSPRWTANGEFLAFIASDAQRPPLPMVMPVAGGSPTPVGADHLPTGFPTAQLVIPEAVVFRSSDGVEVHGQLFKTTGGPARRPALVYVHGGPARQMLLGWHYKSYYPNNYAATQPPAGHRFVVLPAHSRPG